MKTDESKKNRKIRNVVMAVILLVMVIPIPAIILNILMAVNFLLSLAIFLAVIFTGYQRRTRGNKDKIILGKTDIFYHVPTVFILCAIFGPAVYVGFTRLILTKGTGADKIIAFFSGRIGDGGAAGIIMGSVSSITICVTVTFFTKKLTTRSAEIAVLALDVMPEAMTAMEHAYTRGEISEKTFVFRKDNVVQQAHFLGAMDGAGKFIGKTVTVILFIMAAGVFGGIITGAKFHGQTIQEAVETSIAFGIGGGIIFLPPQLLLSAALGIVSDRVYEFSTRQLAVNS